MTEPTKGLEQRESDQWDMDLDPRLVVTQEELKELFDEWDAGFAQDARDHLIQKYRRHEIHEFMQVDVVTADRIDEQGVHSWRKTDEDGDAVYGVLCAFDLRATGDKVRIQVPYDLNLGDVQRALPKLGRMLEILINERERLLENDARLTALPSETEPAT